MTSQIINHGGLMKIGDYSKSLEWMGEFENYLLNISQHPFHLGVQVSCLKIAIPLVDKMRK
jgi:hypothetical protein